MPRKKNPNLKPPNYEQEYTHEQVQELKKCAQDPVYFIRNYVKIQHPTKGTVPFELFDYQEEMVNAYKTYQFSITLSARQTGKEQPLSASIATPSGWTTMGNIQPGDEVLTPQGMVATVIQKIPQGIKDVYRITFDDGTVAECGIDHLWRVNINQSKMKIETVITLQEILDRMDAGDTIEIPLIIEANFNKQKLPYDPYTLGVFLSTAAVLSECDEDDGYYTLMKEILQLDDATSFIPKIYHTSSHDQRHALLQGFINTGCKRIKNDVAYLYVTSPSLQKDIKLLVSSLGGKCFINENEIQIHLPQLEEFFPTSKLKRRCSGIRHKLTKTIVNIELVRQEESACIVINDRDQLYITNDFTVTHNSTVAGAFLLWYATFNFDKTILIASRANDHAMEMISRIRFAYEQLPFWIKPGVKEDAWNKHEIGFDNGSRIMSTATSENAGRGFSISLLYLDEFAFVAPNIQEEFWASISPTLATGGSCIMTSTPNGDHDIFAEIWRGANIPSTDPNSKLGHNGFYPIRVHWNQPPGRDEKFKEEQIAKLGERKWKQEYECCSSETIVTIMDRNGVVYDMTIEELYEILAEEQAQINRKVRDFSYRRERIL